MRADSRDHSGKLSLSIRRALKSILTPADNLTVIVEGAIVLSKALNDPGLMGKQTRLFRNHIKLIFGA